jgi:hypothetical protein
MWFYIAACLVRFFYIYIKKCVRVRVEFNARVRVEGRGKGRRAPRRAWCVQQLVTMDTMTAS